MTDSGITLDTSLNGFAYVDGNTQIEVARPGVVLGHEQSGELEVVGDSTIPCYILAIGIQNRGHGRNEVYGVHYIEMGRADLPQHNSLKGSRLSPFKPKPDQEFSINGRRMKIGEITDELKTYSGAK